MDVIVCVKEARESSHQNVVLFQYCPVQLNLFISKNRFCGEVFCFIGPRSIETSQEPQTYISIGRTSPQFKNGNKSNGNIISGVVVAKALVAIIQNQLSFGSFSMEFERGLE